tara:strand:+ start:2990 stop:3415 length:426 start_codon:yes stop_codon:yes gene_type:complete
MYKFLIPLALLLVGTAYATQQEADTELLPIDVSIVQKQADYFTTNGKYWQGLETLDDVTGLEKKSKKDKKASNEKSWKEMKIPIPNNSKHSYKVDVYESPQGHGYTVTIKAKFQGDMYTKTLNYGSETWREKPWAIYNPPE